MSLSQNLLPKPSWIRVKAPVSRSYQETRDLMLQLKLNTVCGEAACPNIGECWGHKHAAFMILGSVCTRLYPFVTLEQDAQTCWTPMNQTEVTTTCLAHVVVTSVDRDDLPDGGAEHFAQTIQAIRATSPGTTIEILTPDFLRKEEALETVVAAAPDVYNHNLKTVPRLYTSFRIDPQKISNLSAPVWL